MGAAAFAPLAVAAGVAGGFVIEEPWGFGVGVAAFAILDRVSQRFVEAFDQATGSSSPWYVWATPRYLRHYSAAGGIRWWIAAGFSWLGVSLLLGFWVFLCLNAVWAFVAG